MKETIIFINNQTPMEITVQGRVMPPLVKDFPLSVFNVNRFKSEVEACYPNGQVTVHLEPSSTSGVNDSSSESLALDVLELSASVEKALKAHGVLTVQQLTEMTKENVIEVKGIAQAGLQEIVKQLDGINLKLKETVNE